MAAKNSGIIRDNFAHAHVHKHHKNPLKILKCSKKSHTQLHNKLLFNIFNVIPNFANVLTTVKIAKSTNR